MKCSECVQAAPILKQQKLLNTTNFIDGCTSSRSESISIHEKSKCHKAAEKINKDRANKDAPAKKNEERFKHQKLS